MTIDVATAHGIQLRALRDCLRWLGSGHTDSEVLELSGVTASIVPAAAERSVVNGVAFESTAALAAAYDELEAAYREAGVAAWTVWTPDFQPDAVALLASRGHAFDGEPAAMVLDLAELDGPAPGDLDWDMRATPSEVGELNDLAYGHAADEGMAVALGPAPEGLGMRSYGARVDGALACVLATLDHDDDTGIYFVATAPEHRGRHLASRLLALALGEARERGQRTSSLQASAMGAGLYRRLGYREHYRLLMYEHREGP